MNDLISRSALLELAHNHVGGVVDCNDIARFPAVDAEPVRHGRWLKLAYDPAWTKCSECGCNWELGMVENCNMTYCPNCGAKMDGKECVPRKCGTCSNDGWDMPQCRECNEENGFKWYKRKMDAKVEHAAD